MQPPSLLITFFLMSFGLVQPLLAAPTASPQCNTGVWDPNTNSCRAFTDTNLTGTGPTIKARGAAKTNTLKKRSQMIKQMKKKAVQARARK
ncbi:hypothetical protein ABW21_db0205486 [Orbilia brochopaga]|nr:hypothetical protein ABW21_db0205486 [Drechslerella brochopaga]